MRRSSVEMWAVRLEGVSVSFDGVRALEDVSLTVKEGEFVSVIGPNGGGKTTLLRVILGLLKPDRGKVEVFGERPDRVRKLIGYVPQRVSFDPSFPITVYELVLMGRYRGPLKPYTAEDKAAVESILKEVGIYDLKGRLVGELSGGQLQKAFLARALVRKPKLLLLDEPTASLDPKARRSLYEILHKLKGGITMILVTHDIAAVSIYVDTIACLNRRLHYYGPKEGGIKRIKEVYGHPVELLSFGMGGEDAGDASV